MFSGKKIMKIAGFNVGRLYDSVVEVLRNSIPHENGSSPHNSPAGNPVEPLNDRRKGYLGLFFVRVCD